MRLITLIALIFIPIFLFAGCKKKPQEPDFKIHPIEQNPILFENDEFGDETLPENDTGEEESDEDIDILEDR